MVKADLQLQLGYVGLSVVHSLGYGVPIIALKPTQHGPYHSPEYEYLIDGYNALLLNSVNDVESVIGLLQDRKKIEAMKINARESFKTTCSISNMLRAFNQL